ncbi:MAG: hypothetical protein LBG47_01590 [Prevotellaceae bacterium]|jgi:hypothetical protein|nr:hypothetical protein [Prevotellaceae bacterium]
MKHFLIFGILFALSLLSCVPDYDAEGDALGCDCREELFYSYGDEKIFLDSLFLNDYLLIGFGNHVRSEKMLSLVNETGMFHVAGKRDILRGSEGHEHGLMLIQTITPKTCTQLKEIIRQLESIPDVAFSNLAFKGTFCIGDDCSDVMICTDEFTVKVKDENDLSDLHALAQETNTKIKGQNALMPDVYVLSADKTSKGNALQMSAYFHETGKFVYAEPNFIETCFNRDDPSEEVLTDDE